ncbi:uncharacterized protein EV422DRAFT_539947 [Fimicolochytrium jonesii]|uniref:uncharacterized protein n=1 Tax=Fimicolochytrium jonesii TaxID=1396493 RepID=UPI0022FE590F|nr:uncharacterized protein EV422DRAFT_539947 [Fimicolochytrium jonesii]KAI8817797.1 hypothetical protein EV422DRAFT_539947 [Fimicolochytrium jonesii]
MSSPMLTTKAGAATALLALLLPTSVLSFDTGPHNDLVRNTLELYGYSRDAQALSAFANWATDMYAFTPSLGTDFAIVPDHIADLEMQHCNNLYSVVYGANYISQHVVNSKAAIQDAVKRGSVLDYLAVVGTSLHTYQDLYAHSNWAELHRRKDCECYGVTDTFMGELIAANSSVDTLLTTSPELSGWATYEWLDRNYPNFNVKGGTVEHGQYCSGVNKDSYIRPYYEETFAYAFASSVEWLYNLEKWAGEVEASNATLNAAKNWAPANQTDHDALYKNFDEAFEVSYSTTKGVFGDDNGHWKGEGSGSLGTMAKSVASFAKDKTTFTNLYLRSENPVYKLITNPYPYNFLNTSTDVVTGVVLPDDSLIAQATSVYTPWARLPAQYTDVTAVVVRTKHYRVSDDLNGKFSDADPWAQITINGMEIRESPMQNKKEFTPYWTTLKFVPSNSSQTINYVLQDAAATSMIEQQIPISDDANGALTLTFDTKSKRVSGGNIKEGVYNNYTLTFISQKTNGSLVELYIDARPLKCPNVSAAVASSQEYVTFCPNTAFGELGVFTGCDGAKLGTTQNTAEGPVVANVRVAAVVAAVVGAFMAL